jgi:CubicO group peptidase (beta-lactamase class C family)
MVKTAWIVVLVLLASLQRPLAGQSLRPARPESVGLSSARLASLDAALQGEVDAGRKAGLVALVARRGQVVHLKAYGMAERESGTKMTTEHLFRLYSMTKPVTSVALLMLYEEGKFQLSDPLDKHIPALKDLKVFAGMDTNGKMVLEAPRRTPTIHDVFRHTAGFAYGLIGQTQVDQLYRDQGIDLARLPEISLKELVEDKLPKLPLLYHPGERWVYSVSHDVQAYLVERFSGMSFAEFCRTRIFAPLGMRDTVFGVPPAYVPRFTAHYQQSPAGLTRVETRDGRTPEGVSRYARFATAPFGGLSLSSTAMDYASFGQMLLNGGEFKGVRLLSRKTVELMTSNHLPVNISGICCPPGLSAAGLGYGLGVSVLVDPAANGSLGSKGTFGWPGGASTFVFLDPAENMVLLLMSQHASADAALAARFQTLAYQAILD